MPNQRDKLADLDKVDADIAAGQARVDAQRKLIAELRADGHDTLRAEQLLQTMQATLNQWHRHRRTVLAELKRG